MEEAERPSTSPHESRHAEVHSSAPVTRYQRSVEQAEWLEHFRDLPFSNRIGTAQDSSPSTARHSAQRASAPVFAFPTQRNQHALTGGYLWPATRVQPSASAAPAQQSALFRACTGAASSPDSPRAPPSQGPGAPPAAKQSLVPSTSLQLSAPQLSAAARGSGGGAPLCPTRHAAVGSMGGGMPADAPILGRLNPGTSSVDANSGRGRTPICALLMGTRPNVEAAPDATPAQQLPALSLLAPGNYGGHNARYNNNGRTHAHRTSAGGIQPGSSEAGAGLTFNGLLSRAVQGAHLHNRSSTEPGAPPVPLVLGSPNPASSAQPVDARTAAGTPLRPAGAAVTDAGIAPFARRSQDSDGGDVGDRRTPVSGGGADMGSPFLSIMQYKEILAAEKAMEAAAPAPLPKAAPFSSLALAGSLLRNQAAGPGGLRPRPPRYATPEEAAAAAEQTGTEVTPVAAVPEPIVSQEYAVPRDGDVRTSRGASRQRERSWPTAAELAHSLRLREAQHRGATDRSNRRNAVDMARIRKAQEQRDRAYRTAGQRAAALASRQEAQ